MASFLVWVVMGAVVKVLAVYCMAGTGPGYFSSNKKQLIKKVSLMYSWYLCSDK